MTIEKGCGISVQKLGWLTCTVEVILSIVVVIVSVYSWFAQDLPSIFIYHPTELDTEEVRHRSLEGCVISWAICLILFLCVWRIISSAILLVAFRKNSAILIQYWIGYKMLLLLISVFVVVVSLTSKTLVPCAFLAFIVDLLTSYFILIIHPEINNIMKGHSISVQKIKSSQDALQLHT